MRFTILGVPILRIIMFGSILGHPNLGKLTYVVWTAGTHVFGSQSIAPSQAFAVMNCPKP